MSENYEDMSVEELDAEIEETQADPYYLTDRPKDLPANRQKHDQVVQKLSKLYEVKHPPAERKLDADGNDITPIGAKFSPEQVKAFGETLDEKEAKSEEAQERLQDDLRQELELLVEVWGDDSDIDIEDVLDEATIPKLEGYKQLRLLATSDYKNLEPLIIKDVQSLGMAVHQVDAIRHFFQIAVPGDPMTDDIANIIIRHIHKAKKGDTENE